MLVLVALFSLWLPAGGVAQEVSITNFTSYVNVHYISIPNKNNALQAAWVYPTNASRLGYTNLLWTNYAPWPVLPFSSHVFYNDFSVTNKVTNRFRIYRLKAT